MDFGPKTPQVRDKRYGQLHKGVHGSCNGLCIDPWLAAVGIVRTDDVGTAWQGRSRFKLDHQGPWSAHGWRMDDYLGWWVDGDDGQLMRFDAPVWDRPASTHRDGWSEKLAATERARWTVR